jgi:ABC-2 type transport system ATP-binding protein
VGNAIELRGLTKRFGGMVAVDDLSLVVPQGSFYGLVGPNGAGKTTTLSMATGLLRPDAGVALIDGIDVWRHPLEAKRLIGNLADGVDLYDRLTGEQLITFSGQLSMDLVQRMCDHVAIVGAGRVLLAGTVDEVRGTGDLESRFLDLVGGRRTKESPAWLLRS